jgi:3-dehydro-L-gulonate 2-dehydrogenase
VYAGKSLVYGAMTVTTERQRRTKCALDVLAAVLSGGKASHEIPADPLRETNLSQVFVAMEAGSGAAEAVEKTVQDLHAAPALPGQRIRYPGERTLEVRRRNIDEGVPVDEEVWRAVLATNE